MARAQRTFAPVTQGDRRGFLTFAAAWFSRRQCHSNSLFFSVAFANARRRNENNGEREKMSAKIDAKSTE